MASPQAPLRVDPLTHGFKVGRGTKLWGHWIRVERVERDGEGNARIVFEVLGASYRRPYGNNSIAEIPRSEFLCVSCRLEGRETPNRVVSDGRCKEHGA